MVRFTSYIGLNKKATDYLAKRMKLGTLIDITRQVINKPLRIGNHQTFYTDVFEFNDDLTLDAPENKAFYHPLGVFHDIPRNRLIYECVEASPWFNGPDEMTFLLDQFGNMIRCSSWGRFVDGEYRIFDENDKWLCSLSSDFYEKVKFVGNNRCRKNKKITNE